MKRVMMMTAVVLLVSACAQSPTGAPTSESSEAAGSLCLAVGPCIDLILNPGSTTELSDVVADAWQEQERLDLPQLARTAAGKVQFHNPVSVEVTESRLSPVGIGRLGPDDDPEAEFSLLLQQELEGIGIKYRIVQSEITVDKIISMGLQDGLTQEMRLTVHEVKLAQDLRFP
jgi:hypothetical protein